MLLEELKILPDYGCTFCKSIDITEALHKAGWVERDKIEIDRDKLLKGFYEEVPNEDFFDISKWVAKNIQSLIKEV